MRKLFFLLLIFSGVMTVSCSRKKFSFSEKPTQAQEMIFQQAMKHRLGKSEKNIGNLYYPERLDKFFFLHTLENGESLYLIEKYYPDCKGKIDCYSFNFPDFDTATWVDSLLDSIEEERLAAELLDLLENDMEVQSPVDEAVLTAVTEEAQTGDVQTEEAAGEKDSLSGDAVLAETDTEAADGNKAEVGGDQGASSSSGEEQTQKAETESPDLPPVEVILTDSLNRLKSLEYGKEIFVPQAAAGKSVVIHSYGQKVVRNLYDSQFRLSKKETWTIASIEDSKIEIQEEFFYEGKSDKAKQRIVKSSEKELDILYDKNGHAIQNKTYLISGGSGEGNGSDESSGSNEKKLLKSEMKWTYDEDGNLVKEQGTEYDYADGVLINQRYKEQVFVHSKNAKKVKKGDSSDKDEAEIPPVYEYYENGKLKIRTEHTAKNDYTTKIYFEDDYVVTTYYVNNKKVKDVYTVGGIVKRTKTYE